MYISDDDEPKYSGEVEIHETLDAPEDSRTSDDLDNENTQKLESTKDSGESEK